MDVLGHFTIRKYSGEVIDIAGMQFSVNKAPVEQRTIQIAGGRRSVNISGFLGGDRYIIQLIEIDFSIIIELSVQSGGYEGIQEFHKVTLTGGTIIKDGLTFRINDWPLPSGAVYFETANGYRYLSNAWPYRVSEDGKNGSNYPS